MSFIARLPTIYYRPKAPLRLIHHCSRTMGSILSKHSSRKIQGKPSTNKQNPEPENLPRNWTEPHRSAYAVMNGSYGLPAGSQEASSERQIPGAQSVGRSSNPLSQIPTLESHDHDTAVGDTEQSCPSPIWNGRSDVCPRV